MCILLLFFLPMSLKGLRIKPINRHVQLKVPRVSYPGALAGLVLAVNLLLCSFVQFGPQGFDLPCADCSLQRAVEAAVVQRIQLQLSAKDAERLQSPFASGSLYEVLEKHAGLPQVLILRLAHLDDLSLFPFHFS